MKNFSFLLIFVPFLLQAMADPGAATDPLMKQVSTILTFAKKLEKEKISLALYITEPGLIPVLFDLRARLKKNGLEEHFEMAPVGTVAKRIQEIFACRNILASKDLILEPTEQTPLDILFKRTLFYGNIIIRSIVATNQKGLPIGNSHKKGLRDILTEQNALLKKLEIKEVTCEDSIEILDLGKLVAQTHNQLLVQARKRFPQKFLLPKTDEAPLVAPGYENHQNKPKSRHSISQDSQEYFDSLLAGEESSSSESYSDDDSSSSEEESSDDDSSSSDDIWVD